jgi:SpoVK/Ycf46/Vps4 family AAA+-type ATPase
LLTRDRFIKALFDDIRANAPAILFIDEIEFLLRVPSQNSSDVVSDVQCLIGALWTKLMDDGIRFVFLERQTSLLNWTTTDLVGD